MYPQFADSLRLRAAFPAGTLCAMNAKALPWFVLPTLLFAMGSLRVAGDTQRAAAPVDSATEVDYCRLVADSSAFSGRKVRVRAAYRFGFEWSQMYCPKCLDFGATWVSFDENGQDRPLMRRLHKLMMKHSGLGQTVEGTFVGSFHDGGHYGHQGVYKYDFVIEDVLNFHVAYRGGVSPEALPVQVRQSLCNQDSR